MHALKSPLVSRIVWILLLMCIFLPGTCSLSFAEKKAEEKLIIYTVNYPLKYFAERIAGREAQVEFPAPPGMDPAFWMPDAGTIAGYQGADLILLNGAAYAKWIPRVTLPQFRQVNTSAGFKDHYIKIDEAVTHSHGLGGEHSHSGTAFTTWLDFSLAARQAFTIMDALSRKRPDLRDTFLGNYQVLEKELLALDEEIKKMVSKNPDRPLVASHPVYQYFARRYGLHIESVMWEPDEVPTEKQWAELRYGLEGHPAKWMIWEGEPAAASVERLKSMGVGSIVFDPCGNTPENGDFMSVMRKNVENLKPAFQ